MRQEKHILKVETFTMEHPNEMLWFRVYDDPARMTLEDSWEVKVEWRGKTYKLYDFVDKVLSSEGVDFKKGEFYLIPVPQTFEVKMDLNGS